MSECVATRAERGVRVCLYVPDSLLYNCEGFQIEAKVNIYVQSLPNDQWFKKAIHTIMLK